METEFYPEIISALKRSTCEGIPRSFMNECRTIQILLFQCLSQKAACCGGENRKERSV
ncbi:hypothetical protein TRIP_B50706 [uncultured Desulfatiglans sp.]|nr:hypothetical protein TRIP_B50706 [uncultured Desulfatiglans sp.]